MSNRLMNNRKTNTNMAIKIGLLLIAAALLLCGSNLWTAARAEQTSAQAAADLLALIPTDNVDNNSDNNAAITAAEEIPDHILNPDMPMPDQVLDDEEYIGILSIEELGLTLPIAKTCSYNSLKNSPCRYSGSAYKDDLVIAAHNYPAHFGRVAELHIGDSVEICDIDGFCFTYQVIATEVIAADAIDDLYSGEWDLTLLTCTVGGQSRLCVRCERLYLPRV